MALALALPVVECCGMLLLLLGLVVQPPSSRNLSLGAAAFFDIEASNGSPELNRLEHFTKQCGATLPATSARCVCVRAPLWYAIPANASCTAHKNVPLHLTSPYALRTKSLRWVFSRPQIALPCHSSISYCIREIYISFDFSFRRAIWDASYPVDQQIWDQYVCMHVLFYGQT